MFTIIATAVRVAIPVAVKVITHPTTIRLAAQGGVIAAASLGYRAAKQIGVDSGAQAHAEGIHRGRDAHDWIVSEQPISGLKERIQRNGIVLGQSAVDEAKMYRVIVTPPANAVAYFRARGAKIRLEKFSLANDAHSFDHHHADQKEGAGCSICRRYLKLVNRFAKRYDRLERVRSWYHTDRVTPGQAYLNQQIELLKADVIAHEVQSDTAEAIYIRLLDERISKPDFAVPFNAGLEMRSAIEVNFEAGEIEIVHGVLRVWLTRHYGVTDKQWRSFDKGWHRAAAQLATTGKE